MVRWAWRIHAPRPSRRKEAVSPSRTPRTGLFGHPSQEKELVPSDAVEKAGLRIEKKKTSDFPVPVELTERFRRVPRFKRAFDKLTPGRQRSYLYHFAAAK